MVRSAASFGVALPKQWPKYVRSAIVHTISLAHTALTVTRSAAANSWNARVRLKVENQRLRQEISLLEEELRIKDARMRRVPAHHRPYYSPHERLAILELRAARGWSMVQAAKRLLLTTATIGNWMRRLDEQGTAGLVQVPVPVNRFPGFVRYIVQRLKVLCPGMGYVKLAQTLARAGLHLSASTVRQMTREDPPLQPAPETVRHAARAIVSRGPDDIWLTDLTAVPTSLGFWTSWLPFALPQRWPFCWWVAVVVDHYSRKFHGVGVFQSQPTAVEMRTFLGRVIQRVGRTPRHLITDQGKQFRDQGFRRWSRRRGIRQRFGAVGRHGSISLVERLIRTIKQECTRRLIVPYGRRPLRRELTHFSAWYNAERPHQGLSGATPDEIYRGVDPRCRMARFEPRTRWPRASRCAAPQADVRGPCGGRLELQVSYLAGRKHLPIVTLRRAA